MSRVIGIFIGRAKKRSTVMVVVVVVGGGGVGCCDWGWGCSVQLRRVVYDMKDADNVYEGSW